MYKRVETSGSIREDTRIEVVEYEPDPLSPLRQDDIRPMTSPCRTENQIWLRHVFG